MVSEGLDETPSMGSGGLITGEPDQGIETDVIVSGSNRLDGVLDLALLVEFEHLPVMPLQSGDRLGSTNLPQPPDEESTIDEIRLFFEESQEHRHRLGGEASEVGSKFFPCSGDPVGDGEVHRLVPLHRLEEVEDRFDHLLFERAALGGVGYLSYGGRGRGSSVGAAGARIIAPGTGGHLLGLRCGCSDSKPEEGDQGYRREQHNRAEDRNESVPFSEGGFGENSTAHRQSFLSGSGR